MTSKLASLEGRLAHIYYVKERRDLTGHQKKEARFDAPKAPKELYQKFLFYKYFINSDLLVIVTEGKTDIIYLRTAIKSLAGKYPDLIGIKDEKIKLNVRFLNPTAVNQQVLKLGSGFSGMNSIIANYEKRLKKYKYLPLSSPVIFIVDNDDGGEKVLKEAKKASGLDIKPSSKDLFFHIQRNLYLIKTPPGPAGEMSAIEDLFPKDVLKEPVGGKVLDLKKEHGDETSISKHIFAEKVVAPGVGKIDCSQFEPLLDGIVMVMKHYNEHQDKDSPSATAKPAKK